MPDPISTSCSQTFFTDEFEALACVTELEKAAQGAKTYGVKSNGYNVQNDSANSFTLVENTSCNTTAIQTQEYWFHAPAEMCAQKLSAITGTTHTVQTIPGRWKNTYKVIK